MVKKTKRLAKIATMIATSCILLGSIQSLACLPSTIQLVTGTFESVTIAQPSALYESSYLQDSWTGYPDDECMQAVAVGGRDVYVAGYVNKSTVFRYDAFLMKYDAELRRGWNVTWGGFTDDRAYGVAVSGNYVYITGSTENDTTGYLDMFVNKYNTNGALIWSQTFSGSVPNVDKEGYAITATADAVYIAGYQEDTHMIWKYYQDGTCDWYNSTAINSTSYAYGIAVYEGWVYVVGYANSFGPTRSQVFIRSIDINATSDDLYVKPLGTATDERGYGIAVSEGYIYITGRSGTTIGTFQAIIEKLNTNLVVEWTRYWDRPGVSSQDDSGLGIALRYDYVLFTGYSKDTAGFQVGQAITAGYWTNGTSAFNYSYGIPVNVDDIFHGIAAGRNCMYVVGGYTDMTSTYTKFNTRMLKYSTISHAGDSSYACGSIGHQLGWTLFGREASISQRDYFIYRDGIQIQTGRWDAVIPSGDYINTSIDGLPMGTYNYTILAGLIDGDLVQDTTYVTVINGPPVITMPATMTINGDTLGNVLSSIIADQSTGETTYVVYRNAVAVSSGSWVHNIPIVWDIDGMAVGSYNFTIVATDGLGLTGRGTTIATVTQPGGDCDPTPDGTVLTIAIITLGLVAAHFGWHLYRKYVPERKSKDRP